MSSCSCKVQLGSRCSDKYSWQFLLRAAESRMQTGLPKDVHQRCKHVGSPHYPGFADSGGRAPPGAHRWLPACTGHVRVHVRRRRHARVVCSHREHPMASSAASSLTWRCHCRLPPRCQRMTTADTLFEPDKGQGSRHGPEPNRPSRVEERRHMKYVGRGVKRTAARAPPPSTHSPATRSNSPGRPAARTRSRLLQRPQRAGSHPRNCRT